MATVRLTAATGATTRHAYPSTGDLVRARSQRARNNRTLRRALSARGVLWLAIAAAGFTAIGAGTVVATDRPEFCTSCHEMTPHHTAWARGPHANVWCVDCHVGVNPVNRVLHKFIALKEVRIHLTGSPRFPLETPPEIPLQYCTRCHNKLPAATDVGFPHARHTFKKCTDCHAEAGHSVTLGELKSAGILSPDAASRPKPPARPRPGAGAANLPGHESVVCIICHRMGDMPCAKCHGPNFKKKLPR
jgi:hypothetical protein